MPNWKKVITSGSVAHLSRVVIDETTYDGSNIAAPGDFLLDSAGDITIDADGGDITFKDGASTILGGVNNSGIFSNNNITGSGHISMSGGQSHRIGGKLEVPDRIMTTNIYEFTTGTGVTLQNNITASGDISSSGMIISNIAAFDSLLTTPQIRNADGTVVQIVDDLQVAGNITASGNISSSGDLQSSKLTIVKKGASSNEKLISLTGGAGTERFSVDEDGDVVIEGVLTTGAIINGGDLIIGSNNSSGMGLGNQDQSTLRIHQADDEDVIYADIGINGLKSHSHITASGDISSSGKLIGTRFRLPNSQFLGSANNDLLFSTGIQVSTHITASGNISSSGDINGNTLLVDNTTVASAEGVLFPDATTSQITIGKSLSHVTQGTTIHGHITASGNISSSGDILTSGNITALGTITAEQLTTTDDLTVTDRMVITGDIFGGEDSQILLGEGTANASFTKVQISHHQDGVTPVAMDFLKSRGTEASPSSVNTSDFTGTQRYYGYDGSNYRLSAAIRGDIDNGATVGTNVMPGALNFLTTTNGSLNSRMFIASTGNVGIGTGTTTSIPGELLTVAGNISSSGTIFGNALNLTGSGNIYGSGSYVTLQNDGTKPSELRLNCQANSHYIGIRGPEHSGASSYVLKLPNSAPSDNQILKVNGSPSSGEVTLAWESDGGGGGASFPTTDVISSSTDLFIGTTDGAFVSASNGNIQSSGSGRGQLEVDYRLFDTGSSHLSSAGGGVGDIVKFGGSSTTAGDIYYLKTDGTWDEAQANAVGTSTGSLAVALGSNSTTDGMLLKGMVKLDSDPSATIGNPVFLDDTAAGHARNDAPGSGGDIVRIVGYYYGNSGLIYFNPDNTFIEVA